MSRQPPRRFGPSLVLSTGPLAAIFVLLAHAVGLAQTQVRRNVLEMPRAQRLDGQVALPPLAELLPPLPAGSIGIPVIVTDESGNTVESLSEQDFSLRVGGDDRPVKSIRHGGQQPAAIGIMTDISESMGNFPDRENGYSLGRDYSGNSLWVAEERAVARLLLVKLGGNNPVFLAGFARRFHLMEPYTTNRSLLEQVIAGIRATAEYGDEGTALYDNIIKGTTVLAHGPSPRRALVVITDGQDTNSWHGVEDALAASQRSGVAVYVLVVARPPIHDYFLGLDDSGSYLYRDTLFRICGASGGRGFMVYNSESVTRAAQQIASDIDSQYVLEFTASDKDGEAQSVELFVKNHPGMRVRAPQVVRLSHDQSDQVAMP